MRTATLLFPQVSKASAEADRIRVDQPDAHVCLQFTQPLPLQAGCTGTHCTPWWRGIRCRQTQSLLHWSRCLLLTPPSCQTTALPICHHLPTGVFWNDAPCTPAISPSEPRLPIKKKNAVFTKCPLFDDTFCSHLSLTCTEIIYIRHTSSLHIALHFRCCFRRCHTKKEIFGVDSPEMVSLWWLKASFKAFIFFYFFFPRRSEWQAGGALHKFCTDPRPVLTASFTGWAHALM